MYGSGCGANVKLFNLYILNVIVLIILILITYETTILVVGRMDLLQVIFLVDT